MKLEVNRPCVLCSGMHSQLRYEIDYSEQGYPGCFAIRECEGCGLHFNSPRLDNAGIAALYDGDYYIFHERESAAIARVGSLFQCTIGVASTLTSARDLLEVGSAKGWMLALLAAQGWSVRGVEISGDAAEFARRQLGLDVFTGQLEEFVQSPGHRTFPVVLSTDVIEHVPDLDAFVEALATTVARDGLLVLGTPNVDSLGRRHHGAAWLGFNPFHIHLFSRGTLSVLLERHGFEVVRAYTYNNLDLERSLAPAGLRQMGRRLAVASGLLGAYRGVRDGAAAAFDAVFRPTPRLLARTAASLPSRPPFESTPDGRHPSSRDCGGDNLVLIARRP